MYCSSQWDYKFGGGARLCQLCASIPTASTTTTCNLPASFANLVSVDFATVSSATLTAIFVTSILDLLRRTVRDMGKRVDAPRMRGGGLFSRHYSGFAGKCNVASIIFSLFLKFNSTDTRLRKFFDLFELRLYRLL